MSPPDNPNWVFDLGLIEDITVPAGDFPPLYPPNFSWPSHSLTAPAAKSQVTAKLLPIGLYFVFSLIEWYIMTQFFASVNWMDNNVTGRS